MAIVDHYHFNLALLLHSRNNYLHIPIISTTRSVVNVICRGLFEPINYNFSAYEVRTVHRNYSIYLLHLISFEIILGTSIVARASSDLQNNSSCTVMNLLINKVYVTNFVENPHKTDPSYYPSSTVT